MKNVLTNILAWWCQLVLVVMCFTLGSAGMIWSFRVMEMAVLSL